jgi:CDP-diacylglycerol--serine O-phosphatidyltransferase
MTRELTREQRIARELSREHRRRRFRRHGKRAYIRSVYSLPSLATLGNAICGFAAMYIAGLGSTSANPAHDPWTQFFAQNSFAAAAYLVFLAMFFDGIDGRLARFARHTTDFGGQLDSLADMVSFGAAPAFLALQLFRDSITVIPVALSRLIWAVGALYMSCAALRLARFNVSNKHGEQHHFSFLGLPSPGAAAAVAGLVLLQQYLARLANSHGSFFCSYAASFCVWLLPAVVLLSGLLMVSTIRYPHLVNRYLRGKRSLARLVFVLALLLLVIVAHQWTLALGTLAYMLWGPVGWAMVRSRPKPLSDPGADLPGPPPSE